MKFLAVVSLIVAAVAFVLLALNWGAVVAPGDFSLGFAAVQAPLGLITLVLMVLLVVLLLVMVVSVRTSASRTASHHSRELEASRTLANQAESSRLTELRAYLESELSRQAALNAESKSDVLNAVRQLEEKLLVFMEDADNALAASIGELEDRIEREEPESADEV